MAVQLTSRSWLAVLVVAAVSGFESCGSNPQRLYQEADFAFRNRPIADALKLIEVGKVRHPDREDFWFWKFRLLEVDTLGMASRRPDWGNICDLQLPAKFAGSEIDLDCQIRSAYRKKDLPAFDRIEAQAKSAGLLELAATAQIGKSIRAAEAGDFATAEKMARMAESYGRQKNDKRILSSALINLAYLRIRSFRDDDALSPLEDAKPFSTNDRRRQNSIHLNLAWSWFRLGDEKRAEQEFRQAEEDATFLGHTSKLRINLWNVAEDASDRGRDAEALQTMERVARFVSADADPDLYQDFLIDRATYAARAGKTELAQELVKEEEAFAKGKSMPRLEVLKVEMNLLPTGADAMKILKDLIANTQDRHMKLRCMRLMAERLIGSNPKLAEQTFQDAIAFGEKERAGIRSVEVRIPFVKRLMPVYRDYVEFLVAKGRDREALALADSSRGLAFADRAGSAPALNLALLQSQLQSANAVAVAMWGGPKRSYAWVVDGRSVRRFPLPAQARLAELSAKYREFLEKGEKPEIHPDALAMAAEFREILQAVQHAKYVIAVPDAGLNSVSLDVLPLNGKLLIDHTSVAVATSLWMLHSDRGTPEHAPANGKVLLVGQTDAAPDPYVRLRNSAFEMKSIREAFRDSPMTELTGAAANPDSLKSADLSQYSVLHFATHASANAISPLDSAVILSPNRGDFRWAARDIMKTRLRSPLVTLSACSAAGSRTFIGEGLIGLTWAYLQAGAKGVVAGLWEADDAITAMLMGDFYRRYTQGLSPLDALTQAKRAHATKRPYYWAGFQYYVATLSDLQPPKPGQHASR